MIYRVLAFVLFLSCTMARADRIFVADPSSTPGDVDAKTLVELIRSAANSLGHTVVNHASEADYVLRSSLIKLGGSYVLTVEKWSGDKMVRGTKLKAKEADELDEVSNRVVRAVTTDVEASKDARPDDVTINESTQGTRRKINRSGSVVGVGLAYMGDLNARHAGFYFSLGEGWAIGPIMMGFAWDFTIAPNSWDFSAPSDPNHYTALFTDLNFNATYYFLEKDVSPYLSAEFGYGLARDGGTGNTAGGLIFGGTAGVGLFRTYAIHTQIGIKGTVLTGASLPQTPYLLALRVGVSF